jgi:hypothetical protein
MFRYILDTNIFNRALDGDINLGALKSNVELFATHIELAELQKTRNPMRRAALLEVFRAAGPKQIPTESAVWDVSRWDATKLGKLGSDHNFLECSSLIVVCPLLFLALKTASERRQRPA